MVGLSVVLEAHNLKNATTSTATPTTKKTFMPLVLSKATMVKPPPAHLPPPPPAHPSSASRSFYHPPPPATGGSFLDACFLCRQRLLPGVDIYMYKGDKAFCSEECRWKQMLMDEYEEDNPNNNNNNNNSLNNNSSLKLSEKSPNYNYKDIFCSLAAMKPAAAAASSATKPRHQRLHRWNPFTK